MIYRCCPFADFQESAKLRYGAVYQKHWPCLGSACLYVANTVCFLFRFGVLMTPDNLLQIVFRRSAGCNSRLYMAAPFQFINVKTRFLLFDKIPFPDSLFQKFCRFFVNFRAVHIHIRQKLRLRTVYGKKGVWMYLGFLCRLFSVVHIIRQSRNLCRLCRNRTNCPKWSDICHNFSPFTKCQKRFLHPCTRKFFLCRRHSSLPSLILQF